MVARRQLNALGTRRRPRPSPGRRAAWVIRTPRVISTTTGELSWEQRCWLGVLHAGPRSLLGGLTAAAQAGLIGMGASHGDRARRRRAGLRAGPGRPLLPQPSTLSSSSGHRGPGSPTAQLEPAILLLAAYDAPVRAAHGCTGRRASSNGSPRPTPATWVDTAATAAPGLDLPSDDRRHRRRRPVRRRDRRAQDVPTVRAGAADRQRLTHDRGRLQRLTDCEWDLPDGRVLVPGGRRGLPHGCRAWAGPEASAGAHAPPPDRGALHRVRAPGRDGRGRPRPDRPGRPRAARRRVVCPRRAPAPSSGTPPLKASGVRTRGRRRPRRCRRRGRGRGGRCATPSSSARARDRAAQRRAAGGPTPRVTTSASCQASPGGAPSALASASLAANRAASDASGRSRSAGREQPLAQRRACARSDSAEPRDVDRRRCPTPDDRHAPPTRP